MTGSDYGRVAAAIGFLHREAHRQPGLDDLAAFLGLSQSHAHRMFRQWAGVTPKDFVQVVTLARARRLLARRQSVLEASLGVGLSGPGRLHDLFTGLEGMTPGEYRRGGAGRTVRWDVGDTAFGPARFAVIDGALCGLAFLDDTDLEDLADPEAGLRARWPAALRVRDPDAIQPFAREVDARMRGSAPRPMSVALAGTPFQVQVWQALVQVPEGRVTTYGDLAAALGSPSACRAVGAAVGANPLAYLVPCHRVIRATGEVGDYRWGSDRKVALLAVEGARAAG